MPTSLPTVRPGDALRLPLLLLGLFVAACSPPDPADPPAPATAGQAATSPQVDPAGHGHDRHHQPPHNHPHGASAQGGAAAGANPGLVLNDGEKWPTDAALRQAMSRLRSQLLTLPAAAPPSAAQAMELAATVHREVGFMVQHCQLAPAADAVLHVLLARLLAGAEALGDAGRRAAGVAGIRQALTQYPAYFAPSGW